MTQTPDAPFPIGHVGYRNCGSIACACTGACKKIGFKNGSQMNFVDDGNGPIKSVGIDYAVRRKKGELADCEDKLYKIKFDHQILKDIFEAYQLHTRNIKKSHAALLAALIAVSEHVEAFGESHLIDLVNKAIQNAKQLEDRDE